MNLIMSYIYITTVSLLLGYGLGAVLNKPDCPIDKEPKVCTIKLNDANNSKSYLTGECVQ
jgi:hypothetical protein